MAKESTVKTMLMTYEQFAARRKITRRMVEIMIKEGTIPKSAISQPPRKPGLPGRPPKFIDVKKAELAIEFAGGPPPPKAQKEKDTHEEPVHSEEEAEELAELRDKTSRHQEARISNEELKARKLELEIASREGRMLDAEATRKRIAQLVIETKESIRAACSRAAPKLCGITDPVEMETRIIREMDMALESLSRLDRIGKKEEVSA